LDDEAQEFESSPLQRPVLLTRKYSALKVIVRFGDDLLRHPGSRADGHLTICEAFCVARGFKMYVKVSKVVALVLRPF
jgi:hypothetical protein